MVWLWLRRVGFYVPVLNDPEERGQCVGVLVKIAAAVSRPGAAARRVLLVEDNPAESRAMAQALERAGFPVACTASVREATAEVESDGKLIAAIVDKQINK